MSDLVLLLEEKESPAHLQDIEIKPGDDLHQRIAKQLFWDDYVMALESNPDASFTDWYQKNAADKPLTKRLKIDSHSYLLAFDSDVTTQDVLERINDLVLKAQTQAKKTNSVVLYELRIANWRDHYSIILANGTQAKADMPEKDIPVWLNIGTDAKHYSFVSAKKDDTKTQLFYVQPTEGLDAIEVKYSN